MSQNLNLNETRSNRMPVLFVGHGSPMNVIEKNPYTQMLGNMARKIQKPKAVRCNGLLNNGLQKHSIHHG